MGVKFSVMMIFYCYLSGQIHSYGIGNFGILFSGKVAEPNPIVMSAPDRKFELVFVDFGIKFHVCDIM